MTGSHEVRGSIPLGSTNICNNLGPRVEWPFVVLCAYTCANKLDIAISSSSAMQSRNLCSKCAVPKIET